MHLAAPQFDPAQRVDMLVGRFKLPDDAPKVFVIVRDQHEAVVPTGSCNDRILTVFEHDVAKPRHFVAVALKQTADALWNIVIR